MLTSCIGVDGDIAMTSDVKTVSSAIAAGKGPRQNSLTLGYASWPVPPGQLAGEIAAASWFTIPGDKTSIFGKDAERKGALSGGSTTTHPFVNQPN